MRSAVMTALVGMSLAGAAEAQPRTNSGVSAQLALPSLVPSCPDVPLSPDSIRRGRGRSGGNLDAVDTRCMTADQARTIPVPTLHSLSPSVIACFPSATAANLPEDVRQIWSQYPRNLSGNDITRLTPSETSCLVPAQINRFSDAQWASLSVDAKAVMQIDNGNIPDQRRADVLAARRVSGFYLWYLALHNDAQGRVWESARAAYLGAQLNTLTPAEHANFVFKLATQLLRVINVSADGSNPTLLPNQRELLTRMFIGEQRGVNRLVIASGVSMPGGRCTSNENCSMGQAEYRELNALASYAAGELSNLLDRNNEALTSRRNEVNNTIAVLQELGRVLENAHQRTNWDAQPAQPNVGPNIRPTDPRVIPTTRVESHTVISPWFWVGIGAAGVGAGLVVGGVVLNRNGDATLNENIASCNNARQGNPGADCSSYRSAAEGAISDYNTGIGLGVVGGVLLATGATVSVLARPRTVTTTIPVSTPAASQSGNPHPAQPRTENEAQLPSRSFSFGATPLQNGAYATISFSTN